MNAYSTRSLHDVSRLSVAPCTEFNDRTKVYVIEKLPFRVTLAKFVESFDEMIVASSFRGNRKFFFIKSDLLPLLVVLPFVGDAIRDSNLVV